MISGAGLRKRSKRIAMACAGSFLGVAPPVWGQVTASWVLPVNGTWTDASKWSTSPTYPNGGSFSAIIAADGSPYTISLRGAITLDDLTISSTGVSIDAAQNASLTANRLILNAGLISWDNTSLIGASIEGSGGTFEVYRNSSFDGVTLRRNIRLNGLASVVFSNGLTLDNGTIDSFAQSHEIVMTFAGSLAVTGTGMIVASGNSVTTLRPTGGGTLTLGSGIEVDGAQLDYTQGNIVNSGYLTSSAAKSLVIQGDTAPGSPFTFTNNGTIEAFAGAGVAINTSGGFVNNGLMKATGGTIRVGFANNSYESVFTPSQFGTLDGTNGTIILSGVIDTSAEALNLTASTGSIFFGQLGTIRGGTIQTSGSVALVGIGNSILDDVIVEGAVIAKNGQTRIKNGLTFGGGSISILGPNAQLVFEGTQTMGGMGTVFLDGGASSGNSLYSTGGNLIVGSGVQITTRNGSATIGANLSPGFEGTVINQGTVSSAVSGMKINFFGGTNQGYMEAANGGFLAATQTFNQGTLVTRDGAILWHGDSSVNQGTILAQNATLNLQGAFTNLGVVSATNAVVNLGGAFSVASLGSFTQSSSTINLTGTLENGGAELVLDDVKGDWRIAGGRINGGSVTTVGTHALIGAGGGTINGIALNGRMELLPTGSIAVAGGLILNDASIRLNSSGVLSSLLSSSGTQTFGGSGTIVFDGDAPGRVQVRTYTLTLGPDIKLVTGTGGANIIRDFADGTLLNQGLISARTPGAGIGILTSALNNQGTLEAINGGILTIQSNWTNSGTIRVQDATLNLGGSFSSASMGTLIRSGGTVNLLAGQLNNAGTFTLDSSTGSWYLLNSAVISGGTILSVGGARFIPVGPCTFDNVAIATDLQIDPAAIVNFSGNWGNFGSLLSNGATLTLGGTFTIGNYSIPSGTVNISGYWNNVGNTIDLGSASTVWNLNIGGTIQGGSIVATGGTLRGRGGTLDSVILDAPLAVQSGTTRLIGTWDNNSTITLAGGSLDMGGAFSPANLGTILISSGSLVLSGSLNNVGSNLDLGQRNWRLYAAGGTVSGGSISGLSSASLQIGLGLTTTVTLDGVALATPTSVVNVGQIQLLNGFTLNNTITTNNNATLNFQGSQVWDGVGTVLMNSTSSSFRTLLKSTGGTLTIGNGIVIRTGTAGGTIGSAGNGVINQGSISSQTANRGLAFLGDLKNEGIIEVRNGGTVSLPTTVTNYSAGSLTGGRWAVYSNSTMTMGTSTITTNNADILLDGLNSTFAPINALHTNLGSFAIDHGRNFVTAGSLSSSGFLGVGTNSTLYVSGPLNNTGSIDLIGTIIVNYDPPFGESAIFDDLVEQIGTSLFTSLADPAKAIGSAENSALGYTTFHGFGVDATSVLLMLTYSGDANLDGVADLLDFDLYLDGLTPSLSGPTWINGDFDYSGTVDLTDFELYLNGYYALGGSMSAISDAVKNASLPPETEDAMLNLVATVPEPIFAGLLFLTIPWSLKRPRRRP